MPLSSLAIDLIASKRKHDRLKHDYKIRETRPSMRRKIRKVVLIVGTLMASPGLAGERLATLSLRKFELLDRLSAMDQSSEADFYLRGIADGLAFANASLESNGKQRLFCAKISTDVPELRAMLQEQISFLAKIGQKTEQAMERTAAVAIVLQKLREKYPCR